MGLNSPLPVRLSEETRKAAKILRSFVDGNNNGLDKVIPRSVLERAEGFAIFTVVKAGFLFSARAGSGIVIARLQDGSWSAPSAIGLGGVGFGGQAGAEVTDFFIVLNSRSAVASFMSAGSLTLGGNLSVAVGPLGRNAEGSGALNTKGRVAAIYSYSKTKGLFGGVSVEGSVIVERQDANRLAYGGNISVKQILSGVVDPPDWAQGLIGELERATGMPRGQRWVSDDLDGEGGGMGFTPQGGRSRSGSTATGGYVFGEGIGASGSAPSPGKGKEGGGRSRSGSVWSTTGSDKDASSREQRRPPAYKRNSSFNPFSSSGRNSPSSKIMSSSEQYNAGLTWDSDGPVSMMTRPRRGSSNLRNGQRPDLDVIFNGHTPAHLKKPSVPPSPDLLGSTTPPRGERNGEKDLLGSWEADDKGLSARFAALGVGTGARSRSNSRPTPLGQLDELSPPPSASSPLATRTNGHSASPFDDAVRSSRSYVPTTPPPRTPPRGGYGSDYGADSPRDEGYARAVALYDFAAAEPGDLGLKKGQSILVLDKVESGEWWKGKSADGRQGIFPSKYVEVVHIPKQLKGGVWRSELKARTMDVEF